MSYRLEGKDIVIEGWEQGISDNPYRGIADMRNVDNVTVPGEVSVALSTQSTISQGSITNVTFTANAGTDVFTYNGTIPLEVNTAITVSNSGGALPTGMSANTAYYVKTIPTGTTFTLSDVSAGGAILNITDAGSGTNTFSTIQIGTPSYFADGQITIGSGVSTVDRVYFVVDSNGRCWVYDSSLLGGSNKWVYMHNQQTEQNVFLETGNGLVIYKGYLFWFSATNLNTISIVDWATTTLTLSHLTTKSAWYSGWQTTISGANAAMSHQAIVGVNDDSMYFCNGFNVGSLLTAIVPAGSALISSDGRIFNIASTHTVADGATTNGSPNISTVTSFFSSTDVGAVIVGTGIPAGAYIKSVTNNKNAVISANASATASGLTFTITSGYVFNTAALTIPTTDITTCLAELGTNLLVGGVNSYIYPWDRISTSYSNAIFLSENYTTRMVTVNTTTYIFCGYRGRIYQTNGSNVSDFWEIPEYLSNTVNPYFIWTDAIFNRNQLYFGLKCTSNGGTTINQYGGLWTADVNTETGKLQNILSYGTYSGYVSAVGQSRGITPTTIPSNDGYGLFIGWNNGSVGGIDKGISSPYSASEAYVVSDMIPIGNFYDKRNFANIQFKLSTPLVSGESVALYWREKLTDSFTLLGTESTVGAFSGTFAPNFANLQWIQIKAVLNSTASSPSFVRLEQLRIH